jgi:peptide/nickel transport system substrate-binding protein
MQKSLGLCLRVVACCMAWMGCGLACQAAWAFHEAPILAKLVESSKLPQVNKRIPPHPVVVQPFDRVGQYGGTWRRAYMGLSDLVGMRRILYDPLVRWSPDFKVVPNLAEKWEIDETGRIFVFHLVKGVRWSDGKPFTTDDVLFYFEDILLNRELMPSLPAWIAPSGIPPKVAKIDDYTFRVEFTEPYSLFLEQLACPHGMELVSKPKHYLKKFHKKYAKPQDLAALMKRKGASTWMELFLEASDLRSAPFMDTHMPSLCAWITTIPAPAQRFVMERNPYYWKVDPEGNQLPYIDTIASDLQAEAQSVILKAVAGEIDMQGRLLGGIQTSLLLLHSLSSGRFRLVPKTSTASVGVVVAPNLNHRDPILRRILSDPRFRKAVSFAIDRNEINKIVCLGRGTPRQAAPLRDSAFYSASYAHAYLKHDTAKAKALLDEMGLKIGPGGRRMRPDNMPLQISIDVIVKLQNQVDTAEIIASQLSSLGIDTQVKSETMGLFRQRTQSASHDIALWSGDGGMECLLDPRWYFPYNTESLNAPLYGLWFQSRGQRGEKPPAEIRSLMDTYREILTVAPEVKKKDLFKKILAANEESLWVIGLVHYPDDFYVVARNMYNLPKHDFQSWTYPNPGPIHPEQFSFAPISR